MISKGPVCFAAFTNNFSDVTQNVDDHKSQQLLGICESSDDSGLSLGLPMLVRNTNVSLVHNQIGGTCYSHAATSAYINTCVRIAGCPVPSFEEALKIAKYSEQGGTVIEALERLEKTFQPWSLLDFLFQSSFNS